MDENQYLLSSLTKACKLQNDQIRTRLPIKRSLLAIILNKTKEVYMDQPYLSLLFTTIFSTMYFGLLRISEVTHEVHAVKAVDVHIGTNKRKFLLVLRTSKTHWKNMKPQMIKISASEIKQNDKLAQIETEDLSEPQTHLPCPYQLLDSFRNMRGGYVNNEEAFFVYRDKSPVTATHVVNVLKFMLKKAGFEQSLYGSHSLRSGRTCDLFRLGVPIEVIKKLGRWRSNAIYRYLRE